MLELRFALVFRPVILFGRDGGEQAPVIGNWPWKHSHEGSDILENFIVPLETTPKYPF